MATHIFFEFSSSPLKSASSPVVRRTIQPSPEKRPQSAALLLPFEQSSRVHDGSPRSKRMRLTSQREFSLGQDPTPPTLLTAATIDLSFPIVVEGEGIGPTNDDEWKEITNLFPTTYEVWMTTPFIVICVQTLPPQPWPFTIGGYPLHITTDKNEEPFDKGWTVRSLNKVLVNHDLSQRDSLTRKVFHEILAFFKSLNVMVHEIMSFEGFFRIVVSDDTDVKVLPARIANQAVYYKFFSEENGPDPSALRQKSPDGVIYDNSNYLVDGNKLLRPGIMVSSSLLPSGEWNSTTSGVLVVDKSGTPFITVATHGFNGDGEVWHPDPNGVMVGKIAYTIPDTDISLVKLARGIRYVNQAFGTSSEPEGTVTNGLSAGYPPHLRRYESITMNNPFSGYAEGQVLACGVKVEGSGRMVEHQWIYMSCGTEPVDGSCGSPILASNRTVVGFFRYKKKDSPHCYAVTAMELRDGEYEICGQEMEF